MHHQFWQKSTIKKFECALKYNFPIKAKNAYWNKSFQGLFEQQGKKDYMLLHILSLDVTFVAIILSFNS